MCECYDYLFDIAVTMRQHGLDPSKEPSASEYAGISDRYVCRVLDAEGKPVIKETETNGNKRART